MYRHYTYTGVVYTYYSYRYIHGIISFSAKLCFVRRISYRAAAARVFAAPSAAPRAAAGRPVPAPAPPLCLSLSPSLFLSLPLSLSVSLFLSLSLSLSLSVSPYLPPTVSSASPKRTGSHIYIYIYIIWLKVQDTGARRSAARRRDRKWVWSRMGPP